MFHGKEVIGLSDVDVENMYQNYAKPLYWFLLGLSHSPETAEELTAETFYQAIRCIKRYDGSCQLKTWLFQIGKNLWLKQCAKEKRDFHLIGQEASVECSYDPMDQIVDESEERITFYKKITSLDEPYKTVVYLRLASNLTFEEIGQVLNQSANWARVTYYRAKERLKTSYEKD